MGIFKWALLWQNNNNNNKKKMPSLSESSLCAESVAKDPDFFHADSADSDQTGRNKPLTEM